MPPKDRIKKKVIKKKKYKTKKNGKNDTGKPPIEFNSVKHSRRAKLAQMAGFTNKQTWELLEIGKDTYHKWINIYPEFAEAIQEGKDMFDNGNVESALLQRALGEEYDEVSTEEIQLPVYVKLPNGKRARVIAPAVRKRITRKRVVPDVGAMKMWLCNRNSARWTETKHVKTEHSGSVDVIPQYDLTQLNKKEVERFRRYIEKVTITAPEPTATH